MLGLHHGLRALPPALLQRALQTLHGRWDPALLQGWWELC